MASKKKSARRRQRQAKSHLTEIRRAMRTDSQPTRVLANPNAQRVTFFAARDGWSVTPQDRVYFYGSGDLAPDGARSLSGNSHAQIWPHEVAWELDSASMEKACKLFGLTPSTPEELEEIMRRHRQRELVNAVDVLLSEQEYVERASARIKEYQEAAAQVLAHGNHTVEEFLAADERSSEELATLASDFFGAKTQAAAIISTLKAYIRDVESAEQRLIEVAQTCQKEDFKVLLQHGDKQRRLQGLRLMGLVFGGDQ